MGSPLRIERLLVRVPVVALCAEAITSRKLQQRDSLQYETTRPVRHNKHSLQFGYRRSTHTKKGPRQIIDFETHKIEFSLLFDSARNPREL